jgi:TRAP-type mannitol/chloroaromatic compound transport system permease small subunit
MVHMACTFVVYLLYTLVVHTLVVHNCWSYPGSYPGYSVVVVVVVGCLLLLLLLVVVCWPQMCVLPFNSLL